MAAVKPLTWVVAVDGSKGSRATYEDLMSLSRRVDAVHVVTVAAAKDKAYLPHEEKPQAIKEYYETRLAGKFAKDRYTVSIIQRKEGEDTAKALLAWVNTKHADADFLVVGFVGRKGPKADANVFGSVTDMSLRAAHMPAVISKNAAAAEQNSFFVAVDGSDRAHEGVEMAVRLMKEGDRTTIVHVDDPSDKKGGSGRLSAEAVEARYAAFTAAHPQASFRCVMRSGDLGVADAIVAAAEDSATHIICGVDGLGKTAEGKTAEWVLATREAFATRGPPSASGARAGGPLATPPPCMRNRGSRAPHSDPPPRSSCPPLLPTRTLPPRRASLGSVSDRIVRGASCTVICIQGKHGTYTGGPEALSHAQAAAGGAGGR